MKTAGNLGENRTPKTYLTLSAVPEVARQPDRSLTAPPWDSTAYVPPEPGSLRAERDPMIVAERDPGIITEAELRLLWGDR